ncbi:hypothetical protein [Chthonobacter rhizosphaerae]|uniref:hypothetical protein n=1 Tax=Chthonobacter rhizosphaerae TaxID=2735553 RepID=UPI0015EF3B45|nr:hypothetical protein [Chthonobacter rhizosphaerae]
MKTEYSAREGQAQQQQSTKPDLAEQYRTIGIPALSAATMFKPAKVKSEHVVAAPLDYED